MRYIFSVGLLAAYLLCSPCVAAGQDVDSILFRISEVYKDLKDYHFEGHTEVRMRAGRQTRSQSYDIRAAERFPSHYLFSIGGEEPLMFVADGNQSWAYDGVLNEYLMRPWVLSPGDERQDIPDLFGMYKGLADRPARSSWVGDSLYRLGSIDAEVMLLEVVPQGRSRVQESISYRLWVDKSSHLILREDLTRYIPNSPYGGPLTITQETRYSTAETPVIENDSLFVFVPPQKAVAVSDLDRFRFIPKSLHGEVAKSFSLDGLNSTTQTVLDSLQGQVVVLNFWATWCGPCRAEMDALEALQEEWKTNGLVVLAINHEESVEEVRPYIESEGYTFDVLMDRFGLVSLQYDVDEIPTTFVIDRNGIIREHLIGARTEEDFRTAIERWVFTED